MSSFSGYFRNFSTFRIIVIFLLAMAAGFYLFGRHQESKRQAGDGGERHDKVFDALLECADLFGSRIGAQRTLGVALAVQFEGIGADMSPERAGDILSRVLDSSRLFIQGIGVLLPEEGQGARRYLFVSRTADIHDNGEYDPAAGESFPERSEGDLPQGGRRLSWTLLSSPPLEGDSRFASLLSVSLADNGNGAAIVRAELNWMADAFRRLRDAGADFAACVTPDGNVLWLDDDRLVFDQDYAPGDVIPNTRLLSLARHQTMTREAKDESVFLQSDILGSGWRLMVANPNFTKQRPPSLTIAAILFLLAASALLLDAGVSFASARGRARSRGLFEKEEATTRRRQKTEGVRGLLHKAYLYLFEYRMADPEKLRLNSELQVGKQIQLSLVPTIFPSYSEWREFDLYSFLSPAQEVSGDYYDFFMADSDRLVFAVGDVSGKGVPAAIYMAVSRTAFRTLTAQAVDPGRLFTDLNDLLVRESNSGLYVTLACFFIDLPTQRCLYALAGHPPPLLRRRETGLAEFIDQPRETFLGMKPGVRFPTGEIHLQPGDSLLLYTDGVTEARNASGDEYGYDRLKERFQAKAGEENCRDLIDDLKKSLGDFNDTGLQDDDITLLAFTYWGAGGQKMLRRRKHASIRSANGQKKR